MEKLKELIKEITTNSNDMIKVTISCNYHEKSNFCRQDGKYLSDQWFDKVGGFYNGFAGVRLKDKFNFINKDGKLLCDQWFDDIREFEEGFAKVYKTKEDYYNDVYYYLGTDGQLYDKNKQPLQ